MDLFNPVSLEAEYSKMIGLTIKIFSFPSDIFGCITVVSCNNVHLIRNLNYTNVSVCSIQAHPKKKKFTLHY